MIDGFNINCGNEKRVITIKDGIFTIGCFKGTYQEAKEAILRKYEDKEAEDYITKLDGAIDMKWLTDEVHEKLKNDEDWRVREAVALFSDNFHEELKNDEDYDVRAAVAEYSDKYHEELKNDTHWEVRYAVAKYSDEYHNELKNDKDWRVRLAIEGFSKNS